MIRNDLKKYKVINDNERMDCEVETKYFYSYLKPDLVEDEYDLLNFNDENEPYRIK